MSGTAARCRTAAGAVALGLVVALTSGCGSGADSASSADPTSTRTPSSAATASASPTTDADAGADSGVHFEPSPSDFRQIRALLAARVTALRTGDRRGFLTTVDRDEPRLVAQQIRMFDNISQLEIARLRYTIDGSALVVPDAVRGDDPVLRPIVTEHLQVAGSMVAPVANPVQETFVRRDGHWLVGAETNTDDAVSSDALRERPWFGVPIAVRRVGPLTVLVDRTQAGSLDTLTATIRADIGYDARLLGVPASYQLLVDATTNGAAFGFSSLSKEEAAAVTFGLYDSDRSGTRTTRFAGTAIKINPKEVTTVVADAGVVRHELTHYLLGAYGGSSPEWLTEGIATWVQYYPDDFARYRIPAPLYRRLLAADHVLPSIGLFNEDPAANYSIAQAAVTWLIARAGVARVIDLMRAYRSDYAGVDVDALTPRLLRRLYGVSEQQVADGAWGLLANYAH